MKNFRYLKNAVLGSLLGLLVSFMVSCGSSKNSQNEMMMQMMQMMQQQQNQNQQDVAESNQDLQAVADEPCDVYAMEDPARRASGSGEHYKESTATNLAQLNARANLARALQSHIEAGTSNYSGGTELFSADEQSSSATDQNNNVNDREYAIAKEVVKGATIVKKSRYKTANNQWKIYVCVEYQASIAEMAAQIAKAYNEKLTPEQKDRVKFNEQRFQEEMEKSLNNYKSATMQ